MGGQEPYEQGLTLFIKFQLVTPYGLEAAFRALPLTMMTGAV